MALVGGTSVQMYIQGCPAVQNPSDASDYTVDISGCVQYTLPGGAPLEDISETVEFEFSTTATHIQYTFVDYNGTDYNTICCDTNNNPIAPAAIVLDDAPPDAPYVWASPDPFYKAVSTCQFG